MHCNITFRAINVNVSNRNGGVFVGDISIPGLDANEKSNSAHSSLYGFANLECSTVNINFDGREFVDGMMNDQDFKPVLGVNA